MRRGTLFLVGEREARMDRREFGAMVPALLALSSLATERAEGQTGAGSVAAGGTGSLPEIVSGVYKPGPERGKPPERSSRRFLAGRLKAGNLQIEIHETTQRVGAEHEAVGKHLHNEIWMVREGTCELMTNGVTRRMEAGDVGICAAGDLHWVRNAGDGPCTYFVVTVGPPEN